MTRPPEPTEDEIKQDSQAAFIKHVQHTYPGLRCFVNISRPIEETGETFIWFYDLARDPRDAVYVAIIHPRDILVCGWGMSLPAMTFEQYGHRRRTGEFPPGYILANDYKPAEPSDEA